MFRSSYKKAVDCNLDKKARRRAEKAWLKKEKKNPVWSRGGTGLSRAWADAHPDEVSAFVTEFDAMVDRALRRVEAMAKRDDAP